MFVPAAVLALGLAACSDDQPEVESNTPRVEVDDDGERADRLLTLDQVTTALGDDRLEQADFDDVPVFENPDPRGPCGAEVPALEFCDDAVGRSFGTSDQVVFEIISTESDALGTYLDALIADQPDECPTYASRTNQGLMQTVSDVVLLDVAELGSRAVGWTSHIELQGQDLYGGVVAFALDGQVVFLQLQGIAPVDGDALAALGAAAAANLAAPVAGS